MTDELFDIPGGKPAPRKPDQPPMGPDTSRLKDRAKAEAARVDQWADSMHKEGRGMFATGLREVADLLRLLSV